MIDNMAWFFTVALAIVSSWMFVKSYIDNRIRSLSDRISNAERWNGEEIVNLERSLEKQIDDIKNNKDCKKSYYNDGTGCCKSGPATEYLKG